MRSNLLYLEIPVLVGATFLVHSCASTSSQTDEQGDGGSDGSLLTDSSGDNSSTGQPGDANTSVGAEGGAHDAGSEPIAPDGGDAETQGDANLTSCASLPLCDDFDSDMVGSPPSSALWTLVGTTGCNGVGNPQATVVYPIAVDNTYHHSGLNSVRVTGGDGCGPVMLNTSAFAELGGGDVYGRFYIYIVSTSGTFDHTVIGTLGLTSTFNPNTQGTYLELASEGASSAANATNVFMWQTMDSNILPDKETSGGAASIYPSASTWTCVEFHTATSGTLETWVNGTAISGLTFIPGTTVKTTGVNDQWTPISPLKPTSFGLGWVVFSGPSLSLWYDDVALSMTRIGCD